MPEGVSLNYDENIQEWTGMLSSVAPYLTVYRFQGRGPNIKKIIRLLFCTIMSQVDLFFSEELLLNEIRLYGYL